MQATHHRTPDQLARQRETELLRQLSRSNSVEADAVKELLRLRYEAVKEKLVVAGASDTLKLQGEAQGLKRLRSDLMRDASLSQE